MRLSRKLNTWFWWLVSISPILFALFWALGRPFGSSELFDYSAFFTSVCSVLPSADGPIASALVDMLSYFGVSFHANSAISFFCQYMEFFVIVQVLHLAVSVLLFLPDFCHKVFHRLLGGDDA